MCIPPCLSCSWELFCVPCELYVVSAVVSYYESLPNEGEADRQVENEEAPTENEEAPTENEEAPTEMRGHQLMIGRCWSSIWLLSTPPNNQEGSQSLNEEKADTDILHWTSSSSSESEASTNIDQGPWFSGVEQVFD